MSEIRVASRYAKSLLDLAKEQGVVEQVHEDMQFFARACEENRSLMLALKSPVVKHQQKLAILKDIFEKRVSAITFSIFNIITNKNREAILYALAKEFHRQYNEFKKIQPALVTTTFPIDEAMRVHFKKMVTETTGKQAELEEKVDADLVGGFILKVGDWQIDESLRSRLQGLKYTFLQN
ncbi:MAG: ATP synthase F1 subunit delta [Bacteroidota bacterium]